MKAGHIKLADPCISADDERAAVEVLRSGWLVNGPTISQFERSLADVCNVNHAVAISSGTTALMAAMKALGVGPGSVVVVPALTFPAPASTAAFLGAQVRVCDVDPDTFNISTKTLEAVLDDDVTLVVAIDQFGMPAPVPQIEQMLMPSKIPVMVDAACSIGSSIDKKPCGSLGSVATFSFHPRKIITTGEGGALLTNDEHIGDAARRIINHGIQGGTFKETGLNLRLGEMPAAIGLSQLKRLDSVVERRREIAARYKQLPLRFQKEPTGCTTNYQTMVAMLPAQKDRAAFIGYLRENNIEAGIASYCLGAVPALAQILKTDTRQTPVAFEIHERAVALPLHPGLSNDEVDEVIEVVQNWF